MLLLVMVALLLIFPWLNPIASGPLPSLYPWVISSTCALLIAIRHKNLSTRLIALTWLTAAIASSVVGLLQYFGVAQNFGAWMHTASLGNAFGNLRQRNQFATLTSIGLIALVCLDSRLVGARVTLNAARWRWVGYAAAIFLLALGNAASGSRTGMLQWCLIFGLIVLWAPKLATEKVVLATAALVIYVLTAWLLPIALEAFTDALGGGLLARFTEEPGCASRSVLWSNVWHLIAQKPWFGWGWGELDYAHFTTLYPGERFCDILDNAHNLPLHLAVELGVPVALAFVGLLVGWVLRNRPWAEQDPTRQMAWAVLAVIALHSLLEYPLWYGPFQLAVGLCVLLLWRTRQTSGPYTVDEQRGETSVPQLKALEGFVVFLCLAALAAAAWDYWRISQLYKLPADRAAAYQDPTQEKVRNTWFFQDQVQFAELTTVALERSNALQRYAQAQRLLHFSPEPRVIEAAIESAVMLQRNDEALYLLQRYKAAFPDAHAAWAAKSARSKAP